MFTKAAAGSRVERGMQQRLLALALAIGIGSTGCAGGGQHRSSLPLLVLGVLVIGSIVVVATQTADEPCTDPAGRCGQMTSPRLPETR